MGQVYFHSFQFYFSNFNYRVPTGNSTWLVDRGDGSPTVNIVVSIQLIDDVVFEI